MQKQIKETVKGIEKGIERAKSEGKLAKAKYLKRALNKTIKNSK